MSDKASLLLHPPVRPAPASTAQHRLKGTIVAALTPLRAGGEEVDEDAIGPYVDFLVAGGVDGIFALGTTGEGLSLTVSERRLVAERYREATRGRLPLAVQVGAMTTADTVALAAHAAAIGADAVVAVGPPFFGFDEDALVEHFSAAAASCSPVPFYLYEFAARTGYAITVPTIERLRERAVNFRGVKVTDEPFSAVAPYLKIEGIEVFIGFDAVIPEGLANGAAGAVSGLASFIPEFVCDLVRAPSAAKGRRAAERIAEYGARMIPRGKAELAKRGLMRPDVRRPLLAVPGA
jgi:dihydrodipicolinate synthase/N-acetylneuraminate lyase